MPVLPGYLILLFMLRMLLTFVFTLVVTTSAWAATSESRDALQQLSDRVTRITLSNGLRVLLYRRGAAPLFAGAVVVRVGGSDEAPGETGIAHMFEHMAFKGTPEIGTKDFRREKALLEQLEVLALREPLGEVDRQEWDRIHAELQELWIGDAFTREFSKRGSVGMNATTDAELTKYFEELPREHFDFWCRMESERLIRPVLRQFYQERDVVLEERRMNHEDNPVTRLYEQLLGVAFLRNSFRNPVIGYETDIRSLTATRLEAFRRRYYVPGNTVIALVGDVDREGDRALLEETFGRFAVGPLPKRPALTEPPQQGERRVRIEDPATPHLLLAYHKPNYPHPDDAPVTVFGEILAGGRTSPLYREIVQRRKLAASVSYEEAPGVSYPNLSMFSVPAKSAQALPEVVRIIDREISRVQRHGVTPEELDIAKRAMAMEYLVQLESNSELARSLASTEVLFGDYRAGLRWFDEMTQVTSDDVRRVAKTYFTPLNRTVAEIVPPGEKS